MAYSNTLTNFKFVAIQSELMERASREHDVEYNARVAKAKSPRQKRLCAGQYVGAWQRLLNGWLAEDITNLHVYDCIRNGVVIGDNEGVSFRPA